MVVTLHAVRVYGSQSQYGSKPRYNPPGSPIILENYPLKGEKVLVYLGEPPQWIFRANQVCRHIGKHMLGKMLAPLYEPQAERDLSIKEALGDENSYAIKSEDYNWYVVIIVERQVDVEDTNVTESRYCWLEPTVLLQNNDLFLAYTTKHLDAIATYVSTVIDPLFFSNLILNDRIFFSALGHETFGFPQFSVSGSASVSKSLISLQVEELDQLLKEIRIIPESRRNQLDKVMSLYWAAVRESDQLKKFLWGFFALELLSNKLYDQFHGQVLSNLRMKINEREDHSYVSVPASLIWKPKNLNFPLETKFTIVALKLCPETSVTDSDNFTIVNRARNDLAHRGLVDDLPNVILDLLLKRYIAAAIRYQIHG